MPSKRQAFLGTPTKKNSVIQTQTINQQQLKQD